MYRLALPLALLLVLASCGPQPPCDDADPVGPCATSHSHVPDGGH
jgi:hypothetical protein